MSVKEALLRAKRYQELELELSQVEKELSKYDDGSMELDDGNAPDTSEDEKNKLLQKFSEKAVSFLQRLFLGFKDKALVPASKKKITALLKLESAKGLVGVKIEEVTIQETYLTDQGPLFQLLESKYSH